MEDLDIIKEFVIESSENLSRLDREMVELEQHPKDATLLASIFRTVHTIKGTCGFLGFSTLERITHHAETILGQVRNNDRPLTPELVSLILETVDAIKVELTGIEATSRESGELYTDLIQRQEAAAAEFTARRAAPPPPPIVQAPAAEEEAPEPAPGEPEQTAAVAPNTAEIEARAAQKNPSVADSTIRVDVGLLDKLMNLVGELVLARNQILQFNARNEDASLNATSQRLNLITTELQESVMKTRMQPIGMIWSKLPRVVRDLATSCSKQINLEMDGAETELDKTIIEAIKDPLTHIVRNSCDHGIERPDVRTRAGKPLQGKLMLRAFHEGGNVNIEIADDGAGINPDKVKQSALKKGLLRPEQVERLTDREVVNLVFLPGFSTAQQVSSISGRGVGMDVVKTNIEKIGGVVDLSSTPGQGTTVRIKIPLTLAIIPGLIVTSGGERFVIPQVSLLELVRLEGETGLKQIEWIHGAPVYRRRGHLLPLAYLNEVLKVDANRPRQQDDVVNIIVLQAEDRQFGLVVDGISDTQEIVVKPLGKQLKAVNCFAGATIMGDGRIALILDVAGVAQRSGVLAETRSSALAEATESAAEPRRKEKEALLLFRAGDSERLAVPLALVARLEEVQRSKIERAAGRQVVQYRGRILPLVDLAGQLGSPSTRGNMDSDTVQVIVFSDGERQIGLLVDQILDIVEDTLSIRKPSNRPGLLGSAVVGQHVTDFLDLHAVIQQSEQGWFQNEAKSGVTVLITEVSPFSRSLLRSQLEIAGHHVIEAASAPEALGKLSKHSVDVLVTTLDLPDRSAFELLDQVKNRPELQKVPVIALTNRSDEAVAVPHGSGAFADCLLKFDREAMLRSIENLARAVSRESGSTPELLVAMET